MGLLIVIIILIRSVTFLSANKILIAKYSTEAGRRWCLSSPLARIFTYNRWIDCRYDEYYKRFLNNVFEFNNQELRVGVVANFSDLQYDCEVTTLPSGESILEDCYSAFILRLLQDYAKFKVKLIPTLNFGHYNNGTNPTGLIGLLARGQVDIGICHSGFIYSWTNVINFLQTTLESSRSFIFKPSKLRLTEDVLVLTFPISVWYCFLCAVVLLIVTFRFSTWVHHKLRPEHEAWSWLEVILWAVSAVCQQSYSRYPRGSSCRTTFLIGYLITYLLFTAFSAGVTSLLAVKSQPPRLTFNEIKRMRLTLVYSGERVHFHYLENSADKYAAIVNENSQFDADGMSTYDQLFETIDKDRHVALGSTVTIQNYLWRRIPAEQRSEYVSSEILYSKYQKAFVVRKNNTSYREKINYWLLKFRDYGILSLGRNRYVDVPGLPTHLLGPELNIAHLGNVLSSILILCCGIFFSILILMGELIWMRKVSSTTWESRSRQEIYEVLFKTRKNHF